MGTNFYQRGCTHDDSPDTHIGKRSAAGLYCWDCGVTLCRGGEERIHYADDDWFDHCPKCGATPWPETLRTSSSGRELGFNKGEPKPKTGVCSASSFTWGMTEDRLREIVRDCCCPCCGTKWADGKPIENEYGDRFTYDEFLAVLSECPIQYKQHVGSAFS